MKIECKNCGSSINEREAERHDGWCKYCSRKAYEEFVMKEHNENVEERRKKPIRPYILSLLRRIKNENLCLVESWDGSKWSTKQYGYKLLAQPETKNGYMRCVQHLKSETSETLNPLLYMTSATSRDRYWAFVYEFNKDES